MIVEIAAWLIVSSYLIKFYHELKIEYRKRLLKKTKGAHSE